MRHVTGIVALFTLLSPASASAPHVQNRSAGGSLAADGLILSSDQGDRRIRRPRPEGAGTAAAAGLIIKVDEANGGSSNFFMGYEKILPGASVPAHRHRNYDEILFVHRGNGVAMLGPRQAEVKEGTTIYVPSGTRVALRNTGNVPIELLFIFPRPAQVTAYYDELTVKEGQVAKPFTREEFAAFRARHEGHIGFE